MSRPLATAGWSLAAFLSMGVAIYSYRYLPQVGPMADGVLANLFARPWLMVHAGGAATALLLGPFQFLPALRRRAPRVHRYAGRAYAVACLVGGVSGLVLAMGTTAGTIAAVGFGLLAPAWIYTTAQGWLTARARRFDEHRRWMIRSFALTFAAVTLRLYLPIGIMAGLTFEQIYVATAWISWIPNLLVVELWMRRGTLFRPLAAA
ncbi:DUF2306 domain-containing protein [Phenylobacterium sp. J367]|uniref:DUF2306 domain-containing protein n=1 Tax=Phenylobacterium sp. J367 TaxID=2898435 RepID=UPI0021516A07|nr:DUF2306 domain-containing protein [Phenylobacterium sp. J367]MCR5879105.1 DUF2306 domain-containing protein [Phenylobacterium sp. J367]